MTNSNRSWAIAALGIFALVVLLFLAALGGCAGANRVLETVEVGRLWREGEITAPNGLTSDAEGTAWHVSVRPLAWMAEDRELAEQRRLALLLAAQTEQPFEPAPVPWDAVAPQEEHEPAPDFEARFAAVQAQMDDFCAELAAMTAVAKPPPAPEPRPEDPPPPGDDLTTVITAAASLVVLIIGTWQRHRLVAGVDAGVEGVKKLARGRKS